MKNKYSILLSLVWFALTSGLSQNYSVLGADSQGDCSCNCSDIKSVSYAVNTSIDSAWFKIVTYNTRAVDYNYTLAVDYDLNTANGHSMTFTTSNNQCQGVQNFNMKNDQLVVVTPTVNFIEYISYNFGQVNKNVAVSFEDAYTTIIRVKLSDIDKNADGVINVIASLGENGFYNVQDVAPDAG